MVNCFISLVTTVNQTAVGTAEAGSTVRVEVITMTEGPERLRIFEVSFYLLFGFVCKPELINHRSPS